MIDTSRPIGTTLGANRRPTDEHRGCLAAPTEPLTVIGAGLLSTPAPSRGNNVGKGSRVPAIETDIGTAW